MKKLLKLFAIIFVFIYTTTIVNAQDKDAKATKIAQVSYLIKSADYTFVANSMSPQRGGMRSLNGAVYNLNITKDKITATLPYVGNMYSAPSLNENDNGILLNCSDFVYNVKVNKKGNWDISIKPNTQGPTGTANINTMRLSVYADGYASLMVRCNDREPISFDGYIEPRVTNNQ